MNPFAQLMTKQMQKGDLTDRRVSELMKATGRPMSWSHINKLRRGVKSPPTDENTIRLLAEVCGGDAEEWIIAAHASKIAKSVEVLVGRFVASAILLGIYLSDNETRDKELDMEHLKGMVNQLKGHGLLLLKLMTPEFRNQVTQYVDANGRVALRVEFWGAKQRQYGDMLERMYEEELGVPVEAQRAFREACDVVKKSTSPWMGRDRRCGGQILSQGLTRRAEEATLCPRTTC